ncbi:MAG: hypothetical protein HOO09_11300, partial [Rhodospirillaceae bacterium]|nr:hypothetical protein [Rhodospirillaceae bacterium]
MTVLSGPMLSRRNLNLGLSGVGALAALGVARGHAAKSALHTNPAQE